MCKNYCTIYAPGPYYLWELLSHAKYYNVHSIDCHSQILQHGLQS